jgi:DNA primase
MALPPQFLDELRARVSLAEVVGRRVKLLRRGRDYVGLCPFHKEKSPSFNVVEDKNFYHCFGCGAHGDVIGFVMQTDNLAFPEAVETLARSAGLEVPQPTRAERERFERQAGLHEALEAACLFFEKHLWATAGREARLYLERRGLDDAAMRRFRLGFAPDGRIALKQALTADYGEALLAEAGLLRRPDDGGDSYDWFRNRIIFPIGDRNGRIIAFGGRVMGDGQPKYLNSPETPVFHKGAVLYGWAAARAAAAKAPSAIVTEGYMDVIALQRAGFGTAVAPLGTALTEQQLEELWRLGPEPILCFDGDAAGQRAAARALDRALPLLRPGMSLRFATLPPGEDPDTLILRQGADAMREVLDRARPMVEVIWTLETSTPVDTPERRAALRKRLDDRVRLIADRNVQENYSKFFKEYFDAAFGWQRRQAPGKRGVAGRAWQPSMSQSARGIKAPPPPHPQSPRRRLEELALFYVLKHPFLLDEDAEDFTRLDFSAPDLDRLSHEILKVHASQHGLDAPSLRRQLDDSGCAEIVNAVLSQQVAIHAGAARHGVDRDAVRIGWDDAKRRLRQGEVSVQFAKAARDFAQEMTDENLISMQLAKAERDFADRIPDEDDDAASFLRTLQEQGGHLDDDETGGETR